MAPVDRKAPRPPAAAAPHRRPLTPRRPAAAEPLESRRLFAASADDILARLAEPIVFDASVDGSAYDATGRLLLAGADRSFAVTDPNASLKLRAIVRRLLPDGSPDPSFDPVGHDGQIELADPTLDLKARAVLPLADGRVLVAVERYAVPARTIEVRRLNADGSPDLTFVVAGAATVTIEDNLPIPKVVPRALAVQPDGKIVVAGQGQFFDLEPIETAGFNDSFVVARLTADGRPDPTFGGTPDGSVRVDFGPGPDSAGAVVVQPDGRIVVAGSADRSPGVVRLNPDGSVDATFGTGGRRVVDALRTGDRDDNAFAVGFAATRSNSGTVDGFLVAAAVGTDGGTGSTVGSDFGVIRLTPDGAIDGAYGGGDGVATVDLGGTDDADIVVVQSDGGALVVGTSLTGDVVQTAVAALTPAGLLDAAAGGTSAGGGTAVFDPIAGATTSASVAAAAAATGVANPRAISFGQLTRGFAAGGPAGEVAAGKSDAVNVSRFRVLRPAAAGPVATLASVVAVPRAATATVTVAYADPSNFDESSFGPGDLTVARPDGLALAVTSAVVVARGPGTAAVRYALAVPGGSWDPTDDGAYAVSVVAGEVRDAAGNPTNAGRAGGMAVAGGVPAPADPPALGSAVGDFGLVDGRKTTLAYTGADGVKVTFALAGGGTGHAYAAPGGGVNLVLDGTTAAASALTVKGKGGPGRVAVRDVRSAGGLKAVSAKTTDVTGVFAVGGDLKKASLGRLSGAMAVAGSAGALSFAQPIDGGSILVGADLGADGRFGGLGVDADAYAAGTLAKLTVKGSANGARVDAGAGGTIAAVAVTAADADTRFVAGAFGRSLKVGRKVSADDDPTRFVLLA